MSDRQIYRLYKNGKRQAVSLEPEVYTALKEIAKLEKVSLTEICKLIGRTHPKDELDSAIRIFVCAYYRNLAVSIPKEHTEIKPKTIYLVK